MKFTKMHGLGNDFIFIENLGDKEMDYSALAITLCHRQLSIGADGIIAVLPSKVADLRMRIINADGSEANMCGNAIRCFGKYAWERGMVKSKSFRIETFAGIIIPEVIEENDKVASVKVNMGAPDIRREAIPMLGDETAAISVMLPLGDNEINITSILMGVPHTIIFVDDLNAIDVKGIGPTIEKHPLFPKGTNVNFVEVIDRNRVKLRTWERGAGATLACGTGSCATAVAAFLNEYTDRTVAVELQYGELLIEWAKDGTVYMTGPAEESFSGEINL
ncbi:MAG TPA: diaminopimelate epimerase [Prolixibacteraceae bacterium]|nr:diaminopimelate epimerase [Prolixibacteraceae bacterium]